MLGVAGELPVLLHALQPVGEPAGVGFDVHHLETGMAFDHAVPDEAHHRHHGFEGMGDDVAGGVGLHAFAEGGQVGRAGIVDAHRLAEGLNGGPQAFVGLVVQIASAHRVGAHVKGARAQLGGAPGLLDGEIRCLHRQHGGHAQALRGGGAVAEAPVVIGSADGGEQLKVAELLAEHLPADGGVEHLGIDPVAVHVAQPRGGAEAFGPGLLVLFHAARSGLQELLGVHGVAAVLLGNGLAFHHHAGAAAAQVAHPRRPVGEGRVDALPPDARRLHLVGVGVEHPKAVAHGHFRRSRINPKLPLG